MRRLRQAFAPVYRAFHFSAVKWGLLFWVSELAAGSAIAGVLVLPLIDFSATSAAAFSYQLHWLVSISLGPLIVNAVDFVVLRRGRHLRTFDVAPFVTPAVRGTVAQQATDLNRTDGETGALVWDGDRLVGYVPPLALLMEPHTPLGNLLRPLLSATPIPRFYGGDVDPLLFFNPELEPEAVCVVQHEDDVVGYITTSIVVAAYSGLLNEKLRPDHQGDLPQGLS